MSENQERDDLITSLGIEDFKKLSPAQLTLVQRAAQEIGNKRAAERMDKALEGKHEDIARSLTEPPFVFKTDEIQVMAGAKIKLTTLIMAQVRDAHRRLDNFMVSEDPNNLRSTDFLNRELLAHSICEFNGRDFGGVDFDPEAFQQLRANDPKEAQALLDEVREKRLAAIDELSPHVVDRLIEAYQAFQMTVERMSRSDEMETALGN